MLSFAGSPCCRENVLFALYEPGARAMIKVKRLRSANCVVCGFWYEADRTHERFAP